MTEPTTQANIDALKTANREFIVDQGLPQLDDPEGRIVTPARVMAWEEAYAAAVAKADAAIDEAGLDAVLEALRQRGFAVELDDSIGQFDDDDV